MVQMVDYSPYIGTIDGIPIQLHWTFLLLLLYILLFVSLYLFILWVMLFVCVLIHELMHSITSKRNDVSVKKIVLYPFGGGSIIDFEKVTPDIEFRISVVGPIVSLLLAVLFGILNIYAPAGIIGTTLQILFILNALLGIFNILPWFPLDGGRALRSYIQKRRNVSLFIATKMAVKTSNVVTGLFVGGTVLFAIFAQSYSVSYREFIIFWDVFIAVFIYFGAQAELQSAFIKDNTSNLHVRDAMSKNFIILKNSVSIPELYSRIIKSHTHIVLFKKGRDVKIVTSIPLEKLSRERMAGMSIDKISVAIPQISYDANLYSALERMRTESVNVLAVMRNGSIAGILVGQHVESVIALYLSRKRTKTRTEAN